MQRCEQKDCATEWDKCHRSRRKYCDIHNTRDWRRIRQQERYEASEHQCAEGSLSEQSSGQSLAELSAVEWQGSQYRHVQSASSAAGPLQAASTSQQTNFQYRQTQSASSAAAAAPPQATSNSQQTNAAEDSTIGANKYMEELRGHRREEAQPMLDYLHAHVQFWESQKRSSSLDHNDRKKY